MTQCKHGKKKVECLDCFMEYNSKFEAIILREKELIRINCKKLRQKRKLTKQERPKDSDA